MTTITPALPSALGPATIRSRRADLRAVPTVLRGEWIKLSSVRTYKALLVLTVAIGVVTGWAVATFVTDEVHTVAEVFVYSTVLTAALTAVAGILLFASEVQHGTLAALLTAQPARWVTAAAKALTVVALSVVLGVAGMTAGFAGAVLGGLDLGAASTIPSTVAWALLYTALAGLIGLGVGLVVRQGAGAISGLLVWWFVVENMLVAFAPAEVARLVPFAAGYRLLGIGSDLDSPELVAAALTRPQYALVFAAYAAVALVAGAARLQRSDPA